MVICNSLITEKKMLKKWIKLKTKKYRFQNFLDPAALE